MAQVLKRCGHDRSHWSKCSDSWTVRFWAGGKQHEKSFKRNYQQAKAFATTVEADKLSVHRGDTLPVTFREYSEAWLASHHGSASTIRIYGNVLARDLKPRFGDRQLAAVAADREGVTEFLHSLAPASRQTLARSVLRAVLSEAQRAGRLEGGTRLGGIRLSEVQQPAHFTFPTHGQLTALAAGMPEPWRPAVWLMRGCGLRIGEVLAVRAESFGAGSLRITEQVLLDGSRGPLKARKPGEFRDVPVPSYVLDLLPDTRDGYLFGAKRRHFHRTFRKAADAAGLPGFVPHDLRHIFASVALSAGVPVPDVSRWLGHRSINITFSIYSHFVPSSLESARSALDAEFAAWKDQGSKATAA